MLKNKKNITSDCINICLYHFGIIMIIVVQFNSRVVDNSFFMVDPRIGITLIGRLYNFHLRIK